MYDFQIFIQVPHPYTKNLRIKQNFSPSVGQMSTLTWGIAICVLVHAFGALVLGWGDYTHSPPTPPHAQPVPTVRDTCVPMRVCAWTNARVWVCSMNLRHRKRNSFAKKLARISGFEKFSSNWKFVLRFRRGFLAYFGVFKAFLMFILNLHVIFDSK